MKAVSLQRANSFLLFSVLFVVVLHFGKPVLVPVVAAALLAMLVTPMANWLEEKKCNRVWSTIISILVILLVFSLFTFLVSRQAKQIADDIPRMQEKTNKIYSGIQNYVQKKFNVAPEKQNQIAEQQVKDFFKSGDSKLKGVLSGVLGMIGGLVMVTVFTFLLLLQREKYEIFFLRLYKGDDPEKATKVFRKACRVAQYYLVGRLISIVILTILYSVGLSIAGIQNAFLISFIAALLTLVPYVGTIIGGLFPMLMALITEDSLSKPLWALAIMVFVQGVDNYFIEPFVVGGEVNISAFFTILIVACGGFVWGIAGMLLFIPMLGIAKIIFDHVDELNDYGFLVGDQKEERQSERMLKKFRRLFSKK